MTPTTAIVPNGSGARTVHLTLADALPGYRMCSYDARLEFTPWRMRRLAPSHGLVHAPPDHAIWFTPRNAGLVLTFHNYVLDGEMRAHSSVLQRIHYGTDLRVFTRLALRRAVTVTAVSQATASLVAGDLGYGGKIVVIPNSVDASRYLPSVHDAGSARQRILYCGNPSRRKGFHLLPSIALATRDLAELVCATGTRDRPRVDGSSGCRVLGPVEPTDMPALYRSADILVVPSVREGMSLAILEAMASGLPIVGWAIPSNVELLGHEEGGLLAPVGDLDGLIQRIRFLLTNPDVRDRMGARNRKIVETRHSPAAMVDAYRSVLANAASMCS